MNTCQVKGCSEDKEKKAFVLEFHNAWTQWERMSYAPLAAPLGELLYSCKCRRTKSEPIKLKWTTVTLKSHNADFLGQCEQWQTQMAVANIHVRSSTYKLILRRRKNNHPHTCSNVGLHADHWRGDSSLWNLEKQLQQHSWILKSMKCVQPWLCVKENKVQEN